MANLKGIRVRISSVKSTQQITKAMKMVSAAKFKKAQDAILRLRPYANKINDIIAPIAKGMDDIALNPYFQHREVKNILLISVTSDKGLCGSFNSYVLRETSKVYEQLSKDHNISVIAIGKKVNDFFIRKGIPVFESIFDTSGNLPFLIAEEIAERILKSFAEKKFDEIRIIYNAYKNPAVFITTNEKYLPLKLDSIHDDHKNHSEYNDIIFEPSEEYIINRLIPASLKVKFYRILLESNAAEHGARMTAMDKATENADELLHELKLYYNKERQAAITKELLEIVSGAAGM